MRTKNEEYFKMIEAFIDEYKEKNGVAPTVQEISCGIGVPKTTVGRYLAYMREHGMLDYTGHRNIQTKASQMTKGETIMTPILGKVSCGVPKFAEENIEEYVRLPVALFGRGQFFILRANGASMIEADINDGDLVLIRQQNYADEGQIVVALMDDEATLKRYYPEPENQRIRLHPENSQMDDIYVSDCIIQGVAVKVLKRILRIIQLQSSARKTNNPQGDLLINRDLSEDYWFLCTPPGKSLPYYLWILPEPSPTRSMMCRSYFLEKQYSSFATLYSMAFQPLSKAGVALTQGDSDHFDAELVSQLLPTAWMKGEVIKSSMLPLFTPPLELQQQRELPDS